MKLYDNAFSPFARKVRMVLDFKGLDYEVVDGLNRAAHDALMAVNGRIEVPTLVDGDVTVVNSADIVAYLEHRYPDTPVYPTDPAARVKARAWERCVDTVIDPIMVDISYWMWAERPDSMPDGLLAAAREDMAAIYDALERDLGDGDYVCGALSIADIALFPHVAGGRTLNVPFSKDRHPRVASWLQRFGALAIAKDDVARIRTYLADIDATGIERERIFWRGDRIEWLLARGFHNWFVGEIEAGRVIWPGLGVPAASG